MRRKNNFVKFLLIAFLAVSASSCSKYDEGSKFTVLSKKSRLVNDWTVDKMTANGTDVTDSGIIEDLNIKKDGDVTTNSTFFGVPTTTQGTWVFDNDKSHVIISNGEDLESYEIIKLKKNELKVQATSNNVLFIIELVSSASSN